MWAFVAIGKFIHFILEGMIEGLQVCGMADRIDLMQDGTYRMVDLKITSEMKNENAIKWHYHCINFKYYHQLALYQYLFMTKRGLKKHQVECCHVSAAYISPGLSRIKGFRISQERLDEAMREVRWALGEIKQYNFDPQLVTWKDAEVV